MLENLTREEEAKIISDCQKFLTKSSARYSGDTQKQIRDLEAYNGSFWTDEVKKTYRRTNKRKFCLHFSDWNCLANAIVSPFANSPWHDELLDRKAYSDIQDSINQIEAESDNKFNMKKAMLRGVVCGAGYMVMTTVADEVTGEPKILFEFITRQGSVALDPMAEKTDASDAEKGAIVNYISLDKAKRLYGEDVVPYKYPQNQPRLSFTGIDQWPNLEDCVQIVSYYVKNEEGFVDMYKICGNYVVETYELPIKYIPIIRFAGYEKYCSDGIKYSGIVDKTWSLQLGLNIAYSTLMERANRSIKANIIMSTAAAQNLDPYYEKKEDEDGSVICYNQGADIPQVLKESFETGDLTNIIQTSRELIADVIGIPLAGILGSEDKTATEILIQNNNKESNVAIFYDNAYKACMTIARILVEMLTGGVDLGLSLVNGPDVITNNLKHRQELQAVATLLPQEMQPLVAVHMCDTVDSKFVDSIKADIIANLGEQLKIVSEQPTDPIAIHELEQMKNMLDQAMQKLEAIQQENSQLKMQNQSMSLQLQSREIENQIHVYDSQNKWEIERAKLGLEESKTAVDNNVKITEAQADLAEKALDASQKRLDILEDSMAVTKSEV